jgi:MerR family transcriptional regulator/heat shock protein HspR
MMLMKNFVENEPCLTIGMAAQELRVAVQTLRMYENSGLILPARSTSGRRLYSMKDMEKLRCIRKLITEEGLNISGIRKVLSLIPCWQYKGGIDEDCLDCQAYREAIGPCWNVRNVGKKCRQADCRLCGTYQIYLSCKNIKHILFENGPLKNNNIKANIND